MEQEIDTFRVADMFWEEFYAKHLKQMTLYVKKNLIIKVFLNSRGSRI